MTTEGDATDPSIRIGTAGWGIPRDTKASFPGGGSHLSRYSRVFKCVEVNSSFYRSHRREVYARWASETPPDFRFAVKIPRLITHDRQLRAARIPLQQFVNEVSGLGDRLHVLLIQLPPSMPFESRPVRTFFSLLATLFEGAIVCEPRHASWFEPRVDGLLAALRVGRVAADPARAPAAARPGGWLGPAGDGAGAVVYHRWHGSPRIYYSPYEEAWLDAQAQAMKQFPAGTEHWGVFDNTASGAATADALKLRARL
ncbi:MAG: DUF72 domain-containing protein [Burkholderiales bacterium]